MAIFGLSVVELKQAWRLCRKAREGGKHRPPESTEIRSDTDTGFFIEHLGRLFVVVDGSDNLAEWVKNLFWIRWGRDKVSAGFLKSAFEFSQQIKELASSSLPVVCVGHSRGGAIVQKVAIELSRNGFNVQSVISFGSPKVGGRRFVRSMKSSEIFHIRVFSPDDPVPKLPRFRGEHYETMAVTFEKQFDLFDLFPASVAVKGVIDHLSYGTLLNDKTIWERA